jgi:hypothetical protein
MAILSKQQSSCTMPAKDMAVSAGTDVYCSSNCPLNNYQQHHNKFQVVANNRISWYKQHTEFILMGTPIEIFGGMGAPIEIFRAMGAPIEIFRAMGAPIEIFRAMGAPIEIFGAMRRLGLR